MFKKGDIVSYIFANTDQVKYSYRYVLSNEIDKQIHFYYLNNAGIESEGNMASYYRLVTSILREDI